jgi:hypothetical protein
MKGMVGVGGAAARRHACVLVALACGGCIPGVLSVGEPDASSDGGLPPGPDAASGDASADGTIDTGMSVGPDTGPKGDSGTAGDSGATPDTGASDASDAASLPPNSVYCLGTTTFCDPTANSECCVTAYGQIMGNSNTFATATAVCEAIGGPNCGSYQSVGSSFSFNFPQTCGAGMDCPSSQYCCLAMPDAGPSPFVNAATCANATGCPAPGFFMCNSSADCPAGHACMPTADPFFSHLAPKSCQ